MKKHKAIMAKGLYQRKDSPYIWMRFTDQHGTEVCRSTGTDDPAKAQSIVEKCRTDVIEGRWFDKKAKPAKVQFSSLIDKYGEYAKTHTPRSWTSDQYIIKKLKRELGGLMLSAIGRETVERFQGDLIKSGLKPATVNDQIKTLKSIMTKGNDWKMVTDAQLHDIRKVKSVKGENKRTRYLTVPEISTLLAACDIHIRPLVALALNTGMRKGEILALKWSDIDTEAGVIHVRVSKNDEHRALDITPTIQTVIDWQKSRKRIGTQLIFPSPKTGKKWDNFQHAWMSALTRAEITDFHFHDLRHTYASQLIQSGASLPEVQQLLGHKSIKMTMRYSHLCRTQTKKAMEKFDSRVNANSTFSLRSEKVA